MYSTYTQTLSSVYTVTVPLATSVGVSVPAAILTAAASLFVAAIYISRRKARGLPIDG
jgi:hypothetical protein